MNKFPDAPLSDYTEAPVVCGEAMRMFANDLKTWLGRAKLDLDFIALNLGKSLSTIRNWMTGNVKVRRTKIEMILTICRAHESGDEGLVYQRTPDKKEIDFIWVRPYLRVELPEDYERRRHQDESWGAGSREPIIVHYESWCAAANVPEDTLYAQKESYYPALARFVTDTIMSATREALHAAQKSRKLTPQFVFREPGMRDIGAVLQGRPCDCCFHEHKIFGNKGVFEPTFSGASEICFYLPVIKGEWRSDFVRWAASFSDKETTDLWIVDQLNQRAGRKQVADYRKFIKTTSSLAQDE